MSKECAEVRQSPGWGCGGGVGKISPATSFQSMEPSANIAIGDREDRIQARRIRVEARRQAEKERRAGMI